MRYELRTTFTFASGDPLIPGDIGRADRFLRELYQDLPKRAQMGDGVAPPRWFGNRYVESNVVLEVATRYRTVFGLTADRYRIDDAVRTILSGPDWATGHSRGPWAVAPTFAVLRVYGHAELEDPADPTKKLSHPC